MSATSLPPRAFAENSAPPAEVAPFGRPVSGWRRELFTVIFESDTRAGRTFDVVLLIAIAASVTVVVLDSVQSIGGRYPRLFDSLEWAFTLLFTVEYILRLICVERPLRYARSFFGIVDLMSILPAYLALFFPSLQVLLVNRTLRMLRAFRILKLTAYMREYRALADALAASRRKIAVFIGTVAILVLVLGAVMYVVEGPANGFTSIPVAMYWAVTTMTTVGFGDVTPKTDLGRAIASLVMLLGWGTLAVPTGIVTAEMTTRRMGKGTQATRRCESCGTSGHRTRAKFCQDCGARLAQ
jgi:voltage-gated potassium channel